MVSRELIIKHEKGVKKSKLSFDPLDLYKIEIKNNDDKQKKADEFYSQNTGYSCDTFSTASK